MPRKPPAARRGSVQAVSLRNVYYGSVHGPRLAERLRRTPERRPRLQFLFMVTTPGAYEPEG